LNKLTEENEKFVEDQLANIDPEIMTKFLESEEVTFNEEDKKYLDKDG